MARTFLFIRHGRSMKQSTVFGLVAATLAAMSWSLSFIVPFVIGPYSLFDFALVQFLFTGLLSLGLLWRHAAAVRQLVLADWLAACALGLIGYVAYFLAVMGAAVYAGPVVAPAFLGLVPVVLAIAGNLRQRTVAWRSLALPLTLATVGLLLVNGSGFLHAGGPAGKSLRVGVPLALVAVGCWTLFGMMNQSALAKRPQMDAGVWAALMMAGAGISMLLFLPVGARFGWFTIPRWGLNWNTAGPMLLWAAGLALVANIGGAMAWTFASQRLPVALAAQMITVEPASATVLGLLIHRRWPGAADVLGMLLLLIGVLIAIRLFTRPAPTPRVANDPVLQ
jgi:drug/metabolite transporter (DMT)-like permease